MIASSPGNGEILVVSRDRGARFAATRGKERQGAKKSASRSPRHAVIQSRLHCMMSEGAPPSPWHRKERTIVVVVVRRTTMPNPAIADAQLAVDGWHPCHARDAGRAST
jgi:hypothetical protein